MLRRPRLPRRWKLWSVLGAFVLALVLAFTSGFASDVRTAAFARLLAGSVGHGSQDFYHGPMSLEERIVAADVIARVKLRSVADTVELSHRYDPYGEFEGASYAVAIEFTFDALEYLKGSGGSQLKAIADYSDVTYETALGATLLGHKLLSGREERWDDREAIVFLRKMDLVPSTKQADRYWLGAARSDVGERYTIANQYYQVWLPDAATPTPVAGENAPSASVPSDSAQRFLLEEPSDDAPVPSTPVANAQGTGGQSGTEQTETIGLSALKTLLAELRAEVAAAIATGSTEYTAEEYRECVYTKYEMEREVRYKIDLDGEFYHGRVDIALSSGSPAGSHVYSQPFFLGWPETQPRTYGAVWIGGRDGELFSAEYPYQVNTARPLPTGEYRFYYRGIPYHLSICDGMPDEEKKRQEFFVNVTAPAGTLHEAFFDPVAIDTAVGADAANGVLKPASFAVDSAGTTTALDSIAWEEPRVTIEISPAALPANHNVDFIALDGSVALRLDVDDATKSVDGDDTTLTWGVCKQPWKAGDELMLRIIISPSDLTGATNDLACDGTPIPTLTPVPTPTPIPSPTPAPTATPAVGAPKATLLGNGGIRLTWAAKTGATQYKIAFRTPGSSWGWTELGGPKITTNSQNMGIYACGITFEFRVRPKLANGNWSNWSTASTPYTKPCG